MVDMFEYIASNPQIIVNGFIKSGILAALDGDGVQQDDSDDTAAASDAEEVSSDDSEDSSSDFEDC